MAIHAEKLAYWFFRLNGCLTIENFVVHPDERGSQRTDADVVGMRFPYRVELPVNPMPDHVAFDAFKDKPLVFIAEVKLRECKLNGPWTRPDDRNLQRVLRAIGPFPDSEVEEVAAALYSANAYENAAYHVRLFTLGDARNPRYDRERPNVLQWEWAEVLRFIYDRFRAYRDPKNDHTQWDETGQVLWATAMTHDAPDFIRQIRQQLHDGRGHRLAV